MESATSRDAAKKKIAVLTRNDPCRSEFVIKVRSSRRPHHRIIGISLVETLVRGKYTIATKSHRHRDSIDPDLAAPRMYRVGWTPAGTTWR